MCGIAGFYNSESQFSDDGLTDIAHKMGDSIAYRGPDDHKIWINGADGIGLSHRRLAIIDLSQAGAQPMTSACGQYVIAYNGEIYNAEEMRQDLSDFGLTYRGYSDTEVILESCARFGIEATVTKMIGMFAFALWDKSTKSLTLVRDRLGIKPLYWGQFGTTCLFGSELKPLLSHPDCQKEINQDAIASYLRHSYIPAPASIYQNIEKLRPGHLITFQKGQPPAQKCYWSLADIQQRASTHPYQGDATQAITDLENLLKDAIGRRMIADVPLGSFLSGGIDSSLVTALMQAQSETPIRSFSIGFHEQGYNEATHAAAVATHLGTNHTELYVTPQEVQAIIPDLPVIYDEPFADSSQLPTWIVSHMTRQHVTVALSGDGGDELFGGYTRYFMAQKISKMLFQQPAILRKLESHLLKALPDKYWDHIGKLIPTSKRPSHFGDKIRKLSKILAGSENEYYLRLISQWDNPNQLAKHGSEIETILHDPALIDKIPNLINRLQYLDTLTYLPDDILTKVDRASMAVSLEARVPLLDHRVVEFAWKLPQDMKIRQGEGKWILKQLLSKYVPQQLIDRPKMGFGIPVGDWITGSLRDWAEDLLSEQALKKHDLVDVGIVRSHWQDHLSGKHNYQYQLWNILMLQSWANHWRA